MFKILLKKQIQSLIKLNIIIVNTIAIKKSTYAKLIKLQIFMSKRV